jgi:hypothetical protein
LAELHHRQPFSPNAPLPVKGNEPAQISAMNSTGARIALWLLLAAGLSARAAAQFSGPTPPPPKGKPLIAAIYTSGSGYGSDGSSSLIVGFTTDRQVIWSKRPLDGGPQYRIGRCDPKQLQRILDRSRREGWPKDKDLTEDRSGLDAPYTVIRLGRGKEFLEMASWHEIAETEGRWVGTSRGLELRGGRKVDDIPAPQPAGCRHFRAGWTEPRTSLTALIPRTGRLIRGTIESSHSELLWCRGRPPTPISDRWLKRWLMSRPNN